MKLMMLMCLPMLTLCCAGSQRKEPIFHSELNTAIRDFTLTSSTTSRLAILERINMNILGGAELKYTNYKLHDITQIVPHEELEKRARENKWHGILMLLGLWYVPVVKE